MLYAFAEMHEAAPRDVKKAAAAVLVRKQASLDHVQQPIDRERDGGNDDQHQDDRLAMAAVLSDVDDIAEPAHPATLPLSIRPA